jgi:hypothetical protein
MTVAGKITGTAATLVWDTRYPTQGARGPETLRMIPRTLLIRTPPILIIRDLRTHELLHSRDMNQHIILEETKGLISAIRHGMPRAA